MKKLFLFGFPLLLFIFSLACNDPDPINGENENPVDTPLYSHHSEWSYNLGIYEVNMRQYTDEGTFAAFEEHLPRLKNMGVGILWLMPIHPIGELNRIGSLGSYYSVKNYEQVNPEYGTMNDFKHLVKAIHDQGMFVIIDWVANHTSWDNYLTADFSDYYSTDGNGNFIPPPGTDWSDVIDLDFSNTDLRSYMISVMKYWVTEIGIDGFRCDAVDYVPLDFWTESISELKEANPGIFMLAEGNDVKYHTTAGFDMSYAWPMHGFDYGIMTQIFEGSKTANDIATYVQGVHNQYPDSAIKMYFTSNHDENSWYGTVFEQFGESAETFAVLTHVVDGMPLIYSGQEAGLSKRLAFFDKDQIPWADHPFSELYTTLLELKKNNPALWNGIAGGEPVRISSSENETVFAFIREKENNKLVGIFNLSPSAISFALNEGDYADLYTNVFTGEDYNLVSAQDISLGAWEYLVLEKIAE
ncbi:MAG: alpha-amylase [Bacteroidales bacterium]|nr:alpha-amylase [Bacteroidales bacterium]